MGMVGVHVVRKYAVLVGKHENRTRKPVHILSIRRNIVESMQSVLVHIVQQRSRNPSGLRSSVLKREHACGKGSNDPDVGERRHARCPTDF
jgi:hypothetical protein